MKIKLSPNASYKTYNKQKIFPIFGKNIYIYKFVFYVWKWNIIVMFITMKTTCIHVLQKKQTVQIYQTRHEDQMPRSGQKLRKSQKMAFSAVKHSMSGTFQEYNSIFTIIPTLLTVSQQSFIFQLKWYRYLLQLFHCQYF